MTTTEPSVNTLFSSDKIYKIPLYQRHYIWNKRNWEHLWDDIQEKSELRLNGENSAKKHFTGAIVISQANEVDEEYLEIIDGQQRLTTFQIILCVIRDTCSAFNKDPQEIAGRAQGCIQNDPVVMSGPKLLPRQGADRDTFQSLVAPEETETTEENDKSRLILPAYKYFKDEIQGYVAGNYNKLYNLFLSILNDFTVVEIIVGSDDEPEKIFQTINGTGQALDQFDLLRNNLFLRARTVEKRDDFYTQYWQQFEEDFDFWRQPGVVDNFLANFLRVKLGKDFKDQLNLLFDQYQDYYKNLPENLNTDGADLELVEHEFRDLKRYADVYQEMNKPASLIARRIKFYDEFNIIDELKLFILYITNELGLSGCQLTRIFDLFESYVIRGMLSTRSVDPLEEVKRVFLDVIDRKQSFSLVKFVLSKEWPTNRKVKSALESELPKAEEKRKAKKSDLMQKFGGKHIFDRVGWNINRSELFERFCEMWPSPKAMLQSEFKGSLPIVYSRLAVSAEAKPQLERYIFMTYGGMRELSNYAIHQDRVVGIVSDSNVNEEVVLDMKEILFAFPVTAMSDLGPHLNRIRDDVKNKRLTSAQKQDILPVERWLSLTIDDIVDFGLKQSLLNIDATVVTRTGHVLCGTIKHYNADAIYMQINGQIVTVYSHGLYRLDIKTMLAKPLKLQWNTMIESLKNQPFKFITYTDEGPIELSQIETTPNTVMGNAKIGKRLLERQHILFAYSSRATVNPEGWEDVDEQELQPIENLDFKSARNTRLKVITRAGHVLTGKIKNIDADAIYMQIKKQKVIVFRHGLISFQYTDPIS